MIVYVLFSYFQVATRPAVPATRAPTATRRRVRRPPRPRPPQLPPSTSTTNRSTPLPPRLPPRSPTSRSTTTTHTRTRSRCSRTSRSTSHIRTRRSLIPEVSLTYGQYKFSQKEIGSNCKPTLSFQLQNSVDFNKSSQEPTRIHNNNFITTAP